MAELLPQEPTLWSVLHDGYLFGTVQPILGDAKLVLGQLLTQIGTSGPSRPCVRDDVASSHAAFWQNAGSVPVSKPAISAATRNPTTSD